jgi:hypothetical protein
LIQVIPVPGRTVSSAGTNVLFLIWMIVIFVEAVVVGRGVATVVTLLVTAGVAVVDTIAGTVVGSGVLTVVGTSVTETGVARVVAVALGFACCVVQPLAATRSITRMNKPIEVFMKYD